MAELATLARPYAEALFKSLAEHDRSAAVQELNSLARLAADPALQALAGNPQVSAAQLHGVVAGALVGGLSERVSGLLQVVAENGRLNALGEIAAQFKTLVNTQLGSSDATVYSAFPIAEAALHGVVQALEQRFGRKLHATVVVQPELIGGIRAVVGDEVLDTSVKARLEHMKLALAA